MMTLAASHWRWNRSAAGYILPGARSRLRTTSERIARTGRLVKMAARLDSVLSNLARIYDALLGGKDNFAADRVTAEKAMQSWGAVRTAVRENRAFLGRVRHLVREAGIRQFLDIGTGLPSANNVHEVAQAVAPECRVRLRRQ
jgi:hypothetical protein